MRFSGIAAQFTGMKGPCCLPHLECILLARSSLPVPLSPCTRMFMPLPAARSALARAVVKASECPIMQSSPCLHTEPSFSSSSSSWKGLLTKSPAPSFIACTAMSMVPKAVMTTAGSSLGEALRTSRPEISPGRHTSVRRAEKSLSFSAFSADSPSDTAVTRHPSSLRAVVSIVLIPLLSSTRRMDLMFPPRRAVSLR